MPDIWNDPDVLLVSLKPTEAWPMFTDNWNGPWLVVEADGGIVLYMSPRGRLLETMFCEWSKHNPFACSPIYGQALGWCWRL